MLRVFVYNIFEHTTVNVPIPIPIGIIHKIGPTYVVSPLSLDITPAIRMPGHAASVPTMINEPIAVPIGLSIILYTKILFMGFGN